MVNSQNGLTIPMRKECACYLFSDKLTKVNGNAYATIKSVCVLLI